MVVARNARCVFAMPSSHSCDSFSILAFQAALASPVAAASSRTSFAAASLSILTLRPLALGQFKQVAGRAFERAAEPVDRAEAGVVLGPGCDRLQSIHRNRGAF